MSATQAMGRGPDLLLIGGTAALIQGQPAVDAFLLAREGLCALERRLSGDGIAPPPRMKQLLLVLEQVAAATPEVTEIAEVRERATSASLLSGEVVGIEEVARMLQVGERRARHLATSLGGTRGPGRGNPWRFDRGVVQTYIDHRGQR